MWVPQQLEQGLSLNLYLLPSYGSLLPNWADLHDLSGRTCALSCSYLRCQREMILREGFPHRKTKRWNGRRSCVWEGGGECGGEEQGFWAVKWIKIYINYWKKKLDTEFIHCGYKRDLDTRSFSDGQAAAWISCYACHKTPSQRHLIVFFMQMLRAHVLLCRQPTGFFMAILGFCPMTHLGFQIPSKLNS